MNCDGKNFPNLTILFPTLNNVTLFSEVKTPRRSSSNLSEAKDYSVQTESVIQKYYYRDKIQKSEYNINDTGDIHFLKHNENCTENSESITQEKDQKTYAESVFKSISQISGDIYY